MLLRIGFLCSLAVLVSSENETSMEKLYPGMTTKITISLETKFTPTNPDNSSSIVKDVNLRSNGRPYMDPNAADILMTLPRSFNLKGEGTLGGEPPKKIRIYRSDSEDKEVPLVSLTDGALRKRRILKKFTAVSEGGETPGDQGVRNDQLWRKNLFNRIVMQNQNRGYTRPVKRDPYGPGRLRSLVPSNRYHYDMPEMLEEKLGPNQDEPKDSESFRYERPSIVDHSTRQLLNKRSTINQGIYGYPALRIEPWNRMGTEQPISKVRPTTTGNVMPGRDFPFERSVMETIKSDPWVYDVVKQAYPETAEDGLSVGNPWIQQTPVDQYSFGQLPSDGSLRVNPWIERLYVDSLGQSQMPIPYTNLGGVPQSSYGGPSLDGLSMVDAWVKQVPAGSYHFGNSPMDDFFPINPQFKVPVQNFQPANGELWEATPTGVYTYEDEEDGAVTSTEDDGLQQGLSGNMSEEETATELVTTVESNNDETAANTESPEQKQLSVGKERLKAPDLIEQADNGQVLTSKALGEQMQDLDNTDEEAATVEVSTAVALAVDNPEEEVINVSATEAPEEANPMENEKESTEQPTEQLGKDQVSKQDGGDETRNRPAGENILKQDGGDEEGEMENPPAGKTLNEEIIKQDGGDEQDVAIKLTTDEGLGEKIQKDLSGDPQGGIAILPAGEVLGENIPNKDGGDEQDDPINLTTGEALAGKIQNHTGDEQDVIKKLPAGEVLGENIPNKDGGDEQDDAINLIAGESSGEKISNKDGGDEQDDAINLIAGESSGEKIQKHGGDKQDVIENLPVDEAWGEKNPKEDDQHDIVQLIVGDSSDEKYLKQNGADVQNEMRNLPEGRGEDEEILKQDGGDEQGGTLNQATKVGSDRKLPKYDADERYEITNQRTGEVSDEQIPKQNSGDDTLKMTTGEDSGEPNSKHDGGDEKYEIPNLRRGEASDERIPKQNDVDDTLKLTTVEGSDEQMPKQDGGVEQQSAEKLAQQLLKDDTNEKVSGEQVSSESPTIQLVGEDASTGEARARSASNEEMTRLTDSDEDTILREFRTWTDQVPTEPSMWGSTIGGETGTVSSTVKPDEASNILLASSREILPLQENDVGPPVIQLEPKNQSQILWNDQEVDGQQTDQITEKVSLSSNGTSVPAVVKGHGRSKSNRRIDLEQKKIHKRKTTELPRSSTESVGGENRSTGKPSRKGSHRRLLLTKRTLATLGKKPTATLTSQNRRKSDFQNAEAARKAQGTDARSRKVSMRGFAEKNTQKKKSEWKDKKSFRVLKGGTPYRRLSTRRQRSNYGDRDWRSNKPSRSRTMDVHWKGKKPFMKAGPPQVPIASRRVRMRM